MGNAMILGMMEMLSEVYALGDATGIDPDVFQQFIEMFFPTPSYQVYGRKIGHGTFSAAGGFRLEGGLKGESQSGVGVYRVGMGDGVDEVLGVRRVRR